MYPSCSYKALYRSTPPSVALLVLYMIFGMAHVARTQVNAAPLNQTFIQGLGAGNNYYLSATTPADNDRDYDHLHLYDI